MKPIDKRAFFDYLDCPTLGWYRRREESPSEDELNDADLFRRQQSRDMRRRGRKVFGKVQLVAGKTPATRVKKTRELMSARSLTVPLAGAAFLADDHLAFADVLERVRGGWKITLIRSSLQPRQEAAGPSKSTSKKPKPASSGDLDAAAYVLAVARRARVRVRAISLRLVNRDYRLSMDTDHRLFVDVDVTREADERAKKLGARMAECDEATRSRRRPPPEPVAGCNRCGYFASECLGKGIVHPTTDLPRVGSKVAKLPTLDISQLPAELVGVTLTARQQRVADTVRAGRPHVGPEVAQALARIKRPTYYLDFETTATAYPLYPNVAPYESILTQYSLHRRRSEGLGHTEYLADPRHDCRRELLERLLEDLGNKGSIVVYSSFERERLEEAVERFPDLAARIQKVIGRLFDLYEEITRPRYYYHPDFHGSASIKSVLPVLAPELSYEGKSIADGQEALVAFARLALGEYSEREAARVRTDLLDYCELDSRAMYEIHRALEAL